MLARHRPVAGRPKSVTPVGASIRISRNEHRGRARSIARRPPPFDFRTLEIAFVSGRIPRVSLATAFSSFAVSTEPLVRLQQPIFM